MQTKVTEYLTTSTGSQVSASIPSQVSKFNAPLMHVVVVLNNKSYCVILKLALATTIKHVFFYLDYLLKLETLINHFAIRFAMYVSTLSLSLAYCV